jgi:tetratricopeptide (TPR) repeat protein
MLIVGALLTLSGCSPSASLERKIEGKWAQGSREFVIKGGIIAFLRTSQVYASYQVIDEQTIRFRHDAPNYPMDWLVNVSFPAPDRMIWRRESNGKLRNWMSFSLIKEDYKRALTQSEEKDSPLAPTASASRVLPPVFSKEAWTAYLGVEDPYEPKRHPLEEYNSLAFVPLDAGIFSMEANQSNKQRVAANPNDAGALVQLGHADLLIQHYPAAKDFYERALRADGKSLEARLGLSNCYALMGQVDEALSELTALLQVDQNAPEALYNKGLLLLLSKHDHDGAKQAWERLISVHPENEWARHASMWLRRL